LLRRRSKIGKGTKKWDMVWLGAFGTSHLATCCIGALDAGRSGWSVMPDWIWAGGAVLYLAFVLVVTWAMAVNPHFEKTVRIQHDRDHRVVDTGPYRLVRHPGYSGILAGFVLGTPLLLGSWWAFAPAFMTMILVVVRTALEDHVLHEELSGYVEYAGRVRYRLVPGLW
jgi:protein-S-isoprenylcysteine O-methyltransferase Ste14